MRVRTARRGAMFSVIALLVAALIGSPSVRGWIAQVAYAAEGIAIHYFNDDVQDDGNDRNNLFSACKIGSDLCGVTRFFSPEYAVLNG